MVIFFIAGDKMTSYKYKPLWAKRFSQYLVYFQFCLRKCPLKWWNDVTIWFYSLYNTLAGHFGTQGNFFRYESNSSILVLAFPMSSVPGLLLTTTVAAVEELKYLFPSSSISWWQWGTQTKVPALPPQLLGLLVFLYCFWESFSLKRPLNFSFGSLV